MFSGSALKFKYTKEELDSQDISTVISPYGQFGISLTIRSGIWQADDNYIKYTISDGTKDYEYISRLKK